MNGSPLRRLFAPIATLLLAGTGCSDKPVAETRLLVLDGIEIRLDELTPYLDFLLDSVPEGGRKTAVQRVLEEHLLPLRLAERAFPSERAEARTRAETMQQIAGNAAELELHASAMPTKRRTNYPRLHARLPVAMFLFKPENLGSVSDVLAMPEGFVLVGSFDLHDNVHALQQSVDGIEVGFFTHGGAEFRDWLAAEKARVAGKLTFVHPDYVFALPDWIKPLQKP
ncbi:MAG: hypothetical protein JNL12_04195 [Planctomycetes bacterium]|nr:hypothetical protein [Planctomycetota bacterium]